MGFFLIGSAENCDEHVCLCVSLTVRDHVSGTTLPMFAKYFVHVTYGRGSVLHWRRDMLRISGFVNDDTSYLHVS